MHYEKPDCYAVKKRAVISDSAGYTVEARLLSVGKGYMVDVREWDRRNPVARMTMDGITLTDYEAGKLRDILGEFLGISDVKGVEDGTADQGACPAGV